MFASSFDGASGDGLSVPRDTDGAAFGIFGIKRLHVAQRLADEQALAGTVVQAADDLVSFRNLGHRYGTTGNLDGGQMCHVHHLTFIA
jgi:hypothetical protein